MAAEPRTFVDTNVLIYAHDRSDPDKQAVAQSILQRLWDDGSGTLSTQILQEVFVVATSWHKLAMPLQHARALVEVYSAWPTVVVEPALIISASRLMEEHQLSFWDALVVEAARVAGAGTLLTEDLRDGQWFGDLQVVNPFPGRHRTHEDAQPAADS